MKIIVSFCILVAVATAQKIEMSEEAWDKIMKLQNDCVEQTGANPDSVEESRRTHSFAAHEDLKDFYFCFFKRIGIITSSGQLNLELALSRLLPGVNKRAAEQLLNKCKTRTGTDASDTAFQILSCYYAGADQHVLF